MKAAVVVLALAGATLALQAKNDPFWVAYKQQFNKVYDETEEASRYEIFSRNMIRASELNEQDTATYGWTEYSDRENFLTPLDIPAYIERTDVQVSDAPTTFDWRDKGAVNSVKDQASCGSCWAFCAVSAIEGSYFLNHGSLLRFSEQQLVDCDTNDSGCNGGWPTTAFSWLKSHGGIMLESDYTYTARQGTCRFSSSKAKANISSSYTFTARNEEKMMTAMQQYGPLAVAVDAGKFNSYSSGIMNGSNCATGSPNHGVTAVGWGVSNGVKYWIIRNSWGSSWGESGYVRLLKGSNACGVEDYPMGVVVA